ncbi:MAG: hypothetical protein WBY94_07690, partial [Polyangiaceae bacterium]
MRPEANPLTAERVDPVLLGATGLVAGGLFLSAPWQVAAAAAIIVLLLAFSGRTTAFAAMAGVVAIGVGALRARSAVAHYEA